MNEHPAACVAVVTRGTAPGALSLRQIDQLVPLSAGPGMRRVKRLDGTQGSRLVGPPALGQPRIALVAQVCAGTRIAAAVEVVDAHAA